MVHLVEIGGRELSVGILAGCRSPFTESTPTALGLSQPEVVCTYWKYKIMENTRNTAAPKTHNKNHSSPATATTSGRLAMKHVPRVSPYSPASIDPGFVEIGLVQLSQSVKTTKISHTHRRIHRQIDRQTDRQTYRHTDRQINGLTK